MFAAHAYSIPCTCTRSISLFGIGTLLNRVDRSGDGEPVLQWAITFFCGCSAAERAPYLDGIAALLRNEGESVEVREAACRFFGECSVKERSPFMDDINVLLNEWDFHVQRLALSFFFACSAPERKPHMDRIVSLLDDDDGDVLYEDIWSFLSTCSVEERAPYMSTITALLQHTNLFLRSMVWS